MYFGVSQDKYIYYTSAYNISPDVPDNSSEESQLAKGEKKMSDSILAILQHFKQPNPVGIPGADIPEPYPLPDMKQTINIATIHFKNTAVYGLSKFRILYVNAEIGAMEVSEMTI